ncbi:EspA/EspE family type VII secretion system effector [Mycolicibacterium goodii]|uniref:TPR repeat region-containing protein n=1 Tax=Mycolicibacterium goodii TaxID=134601 RepID=UPI000673934D
MGALDGFYSTWNKARETFGQGTPTDGSQFDRSSELLNMKASVEAAAPDDRWQGSGANAYAAANKEHAQVYEKLAELDRKMAAEVKNAANVVSVGRTNLDTAKGWVESMVNSLPATNEQDRERKLIPIAREGINKVDNIVKSATDDMRTIQGRVTGYKGEFEDLTNQKFAPSGDKDGKKDGEDKDDLLSARGEGDESTEESPAESGAADSEALQNGELTPEQRDRLVENTSLSPEQQAALDNGTLQLPPERMAYLQGFSQAFGDKTPAEIKAIMDQADAESAGTGGRVADAFQLASNENIKTGLPETNPPSIDHPSSGGKYALPEGVRDVLDGPVMTQEYTDGVFQDGRWIVPPEPTGPMHATPGLNDLADIIQRGNDNLQSGTALDAGLLAKSQELLDQSNHLPMSQANMPGGDAAERPRWYHEQIDPALQNMLNAVNKDDMVIHNAIVGPPQTHEPYGNTTVLSPEGQKFLDNLAQHQWQDDGLAAGGLFDWVGETANNDINNRAADTAHALAEFTSNNHDRLLNLPGTDKLPLGQVNPELTRDWARSLSPYFDDMVGEHGNDSNGIFSPLDPDGTPSPENTRHLMSVFASDQPPPNAKADDGHPLTASEISFNGTKSHVEDALSQAALSIPDPSAGDNLQAMKHAGRLQAAFDLGTYDEAADRLQNEFDARHSAWELRSKLFDLAMFDVGNLPFPHTSEVSGAFSLGKEFLIGHEPTPGAPPNVNLPDTYQAEKVMVETLARNGYGDPSIFGGNLIGGELNPPNQTGSDAFNDFRQQMTDYLNGIDFRNPDPTGGFNQMIDEYWKTYTTAVASGYHQK